ncbi:hypothetical protein PC123_g7288 [Phytophthora cactorum]|nr:hypothetical protein PC123_g7288 [Phytophthora cactorum]
MCCSCVYSSCFVTLTAYVVSLEDGDGVGAESGERGGRECRASPSVGHGAHVARVLTQVGAYKYKLGEGLTTANSVYLLWLHLPQAV